MQQRDPKMNVITQSAAPEVNFEYTDCGLILPCMAAGFIPNNEGRPFTEKHVYKRNYGTTQKPSFKRHVDYIFKGTVQENPMDRVCPHCGSYMHTHDRHTTRLKHVPFGKKGILFEVEHCRYRCPKCRAVKQQTIPFQAQNMRLTNAMREYIICLLEYGDTGKSIAQRTGVNRHLIKDIDKQRLTDLYIEEKDGRRSWRKPTRQARYLGIDEFKLRAGYQMATVIIDLETGEVLWLQESKRKQVVYDFIEHVGSEWMSNVKAIACDMNADFASAFKNKCPHLDIVYDHFHLIKNFNEKVISRVRIDEQKRLINDDNPEGAESLKRTRFILTANLSTLERRDQESREFNAMLSQIRNGDSNVAFINVKPIRAKRTDRVETYKKLIAENELLLCVELIKEKLNDAYSTALTAKQMECIMNEIIDLCNGSKNKHLLWFARLISNHMEGITSFAEHGITSGKCEGTVQLIKTIRRASYGLPDTEYFFLKIMDASRRYTNVPHNLSTNVDEPTTTPTDALAEQLDEASPLNKTNGIAASRLICL